MILEQELEAAFDSSERLERMKAEVESAARARDLQLRNIKERWGIGPFLHVKNGKQYQIVQRGESFYFRESKEKK